MATTTRTTTAVEVQKKWRYEEDSATGSSPDRTVIWKEAASPRRRVPVVYYLSRNGSLEHPHFMEITLSSSSQGLFLRDFIDRLNQLRGKGIASIYSWSSKRSYKNGYVWHDLSENDFIYPSHGTEYVLKGSELLDVSPDETPPFQSPTSTDSSSQKPTFHANPRAAVSRRRNQSMSAIELDRDNYKVYKTESSTRSRAAADASTQTYDQRIEEEEEEEEIIQEVQSSTETSPPPVDSSPETLQTVLKTRGRLRLRGGGATDDGSSQLPLPGGRVRASSILMQMISCGAVSFKDCGVSLKSQGMSMVANSKVRVRRGTGNHSLSDTHAGLSGRHELENKEYFSGSLVETKKEKMVPVLKRSSSYNMDRGFDSKIDHPRWNEVQAESRAIHTTKKKPA